MRDGIIGENTDLNSVRNLPSLSSVRSRMNARLRQLEAEGLSPADIEQALIAEFNILPKSILTQARAGTGATTAVDLSNSSLIGQ